MSKFSVKKPFTVLVAVILVIILGVVSFTKMSLDLIPSINLPYAVVVTSYVGATPETVEMAVTAPIEQALASVNNVDEIISSSAEHVSMIIIAFNNDTNMDSAVLEIRESLDLIASNLPETAGSPMIIKINPNMMPINVMAVSVENMNNQEAAFFIDNKIIPELNSTEGIATVTSTGILENYVDVTINREKIAILEQYLASLQGDEGATTKIDISKDTINQILTAQNFSMPAGSVIDTNGQSMMVRVGDKITSVEELKNLTLVGGIKLSDICDVTVYDNSNTVYSKVNGNYAVMLMASKQSNYSTSDVCHNLQDKMEELEKDNSNLHFDSLMDQGIYIDLMINSIVKNLISGAILAVIVLFIFLRKIRPTLIVTTSIIISVIATFVLMYFTGITMNLISMGGLALGVGMLVDNSIVVIENIFRMRNNGMSARDAAIEGAKEVSGAIIASTITTVVVFLPIVFTSGLTRQLFVDMALTIGFSLLASLVVALTVVPATASRALVKNFKQDTKPNRFANAYAKLLEKVLRFKPITMLVSVVLLVVSIVAAFASGVELFPTTDTGSVTITATLPEGYTAEEKYAELDRLYDILSSVDEVETIGIMDSSESTDATGSMMSMMGGGSTSAYILLEEGHKRSTDEVVEELREKTSQLPYEVSFSSSSMDLSAMSGGQVVVNLYAADKDSLQKMAKDITKMMSEIDGIVELESQLSETTNDLKITVDKAKAIGSGVTVAQVYMAVAEALASPTAATTITEDGLEYSVFIKDSKDVKVKYEEIGNIQIQTMMGTFVKISDVAEIGVGEGFSAINRINQERYTTISASLENGYELSDINAQIEEKINGYDMPKGSRYEFGGESVQIEETFKDLFLMIILAIVFIYLVMVAQFQSLLSPFIVMFTIPLAFTGGFLALFITGTSISVISLIGLVVLVGVVVNNGIVFVDYTNQQREKGSTVTEALILAAKHRIRPILMTALTTIIALVMMAFDTGDGAEMMKPLAITAIGGLAYSTLLTLFVIPTMYAIFNKDKKKTKAE